MIESVIVVIREVTQQNEKRNLACRQSLRERVFYGQTLIEILITIFYAGPLLNTPGSQK